MNPQPANVLDRDAIFEQLSLLDSSDPGAPAKSAEASSTVKELKAELDTLIGQLRQPAEPDPYSCETGLRRAQELVLAIGLEPSSEAKTVVERQELGWIGPYRLLEKLGEGGMGAVYKALHSSLEKIVALKVLPQDRLNPQAIARFKREMKAVGKLDHPNIVRATDAGEADGDHFLVMEYVEGVDLAELLRRVGPLPAAEACELVRQAAVGLQHAHQRGMVHRDIKPNNIMLAWGDELGAGHSQLGAGLPTPHPAAVKILDMGLALLNEQKAPAHGELTTTGQMMGTLEYMSPEQGLDTHNVDIRADIYSLGATLYKLLCGKAPFAGEQYNNPLQLIFALATQTPPSIGTQRVGLPAGLVALVDRMLAREPAERPATPAEVAQSLASFASGADLSRLSNSARHHGTSADKTTDQSITPTEQFLSSPSTGTQPTLKPEAQAKDSHQPEASARESAATPSLARQASMRIRNLQSTFRNPKWLAAIAAGLLALAAGVFGIIRITTPDGDYVIQTDDPDFSFSVSKGVVTLHDKKTKREYTMKVVRQDDGAFVLDVTDVGADLSFKTKEFTIKRDQQVALKAHFERKPAEVVNAPSRPGWFSNGRSDFEPKPADVVNGPPTTDPDRRAAEWMLSGFGIAIVNVDVEDRGFERAFEVRQVANIPKGPFRLIFGNMSRNTRLSDEGLAHFQDCKNLRTLQLGGASMRDAWLSHFKNCTALVELHLNETAIGDAGLAHFQDCKELARLTLNNTQVSDASLERLVDFPKLVALNVKSTKVTESGVKKLSAALPGCKIEWDGGTVEGGKK